MRSSSSDEDADNTEKGGFEPPIGVTLYTLSKRAPSTTRPSLRNQAIKWLDCGDLAQVPTGALGAQASSLQTRPQLPYAPSRIRNLRTDSAGKMRFDYAQDRPTLPGSNLRLSH